MKHTLPSFLTTMIPMDDYVGTWQDLLYSASQAGMELLFYGFYLHVFISAIHNLLYRCSAAGKSILILASCAMFLVGTVQLALQLVSVGVYIRILQQQMGAGADGYNTLIVLSHIILAFNTLVADSLFTYRCYILWGRRKAVILLPVLLMLSTLALGVAIQFLPALYTIRITQIEFVVVAVTNVLLTVLAASRIWWIRRKGGPESILRQRCNSAFAFILESGVLYCIWSILLVCTISIKPEADSIVFAVVLGSAKQGVNMVPTLSLVLGKDAGAPEPNLTENPGKVGNRAGVDSIGV
ncbi:hypothetical protein FB45DRAFT_531807 [Roridomyces roridus]|uniref:Uncharacterized protein n=1 Tax=Roridomyces roridus TaxID=1738132 RepID=A0AAD7BT48_9AGAR|nr:hypothetical protein FB45DRAFT_531807 [Roridomyces roridus]